MKHIISLRNGFVLSKEGRFLRNQSLQLVSELMQFGYIADPKVFKGYTEEDLNEYYKEVIPYLKRITGSNRSFKPFWKNFPNDVMERSEMELWLHQIVHYMSNGTYEPSEFTKQTRRTAFEQESYTTLISGTENDLDNVFTKLVSINSSLTTDDTQVVVWFARSGRKLNVPEEIPFKETLILLASLGVEVKIKTVTDVLRIAVGLSGGDISLPAITDKNKKTEKFRKFTRKERKYLLNLLENTNCSDSEAVMKDGRWKRLGEIIHPGEYENKYPKAAAMFKAIRDGYARSWYSQFNSLVSEDFDKSLVFLSKRPGEYARKLDWLLRTYNQKKVIAQFKLIADKISNKVLFELYNHFESRNQYRNRSVFIKGARKPTILDPLIPLGDKTIVAITDTIKEILAKKFSILENLGKVYLDENLKKIPLPSNMRSASSSLRPIIRGARIPFEITDPTIRAFVHWFDDNGTEDIDLTATFLGDGKTERIGWNGLHNEYIGCYSGDVRHKKGACAEYIDINISKALEKGYNYVVIDARNYNQKPFKFTKECVFGLMGRKFPEANGIFVPATISNCIKLESPAIATIVAILDLATQKYIMLDIDSADIPVASADSDNIMKAVKMYTEEPKFSVYDLLKIHVDNRGILVYNADEADKSFMFEDFSTSYVKIFEFMGI